MGYTLREISIGACTLFLRRVSRFNFRLHYVTHIIITINTEQYVLKPFGRSGKDQSSRWPINNALQYLNLIKVSTILKCERNSDSSSQNDFNFLR